MLGKLLKYEFRATKRIQLSILLGSLCASLLGAGLLFCLLSPAVLPAVKEASPGLFTTLSIVGWMVTGALYLLAFSSLVVSLIMLLVRFYRNFYTDEGYLTFTLPVQPRALVWSKLISSMVWLFGMTAAELFAVFSLGSGITLARGEFAGFVDGIRVFILGLTEELGVIFGSLPLPIRDPALFSSTFLALLILAAVVSTAEQMLIYFLSITLGSVVAKKHKIWAAIGLYFVINTGINWIFSLISVFLSPTFIAGLVIDNLFLHLTLIGYILLTTLFGAVIFARITSSMKKKLNLN